MMKKQWKRAVYFLIGSAFLMVNGQFIEAKSVSGHQNMQKNNRTDQYKDSVKGVLDLSVLPVVKGNIAQYLPTPYGNLEGLLLTDGTQVLFSTMFGEMVKSFVHPGQTIAIHGLKAYSLPLIQAFMIVNQRGEQIQEDSPDANFAPVPITGPDLVVNGTIRQLLYNLQGQVMGMVLKDGTVIYLRSSDVARLGFILKPGIFIYVHGMGSVNALGKALQARSIGQTENNMVELSQFNAPPVGAPAGSPSYDYIP